MQAGGGQRSTPLRLRNRRRRGYFFFRGVTKNNTATMQIEIRTSSQLRKFPTAKKKGIGMSVVAYIISKGRRNRPEKNDPRAGVGQ
jgi:hypothetical protein